jgi:alanyl-tRNA synthetase
VKQAGSLVAPDRIRFDFVHGGQVGADDLARIERLVNERILANLPVQTELRGTEEAIAAGAIALFGEKYCERARVVTIPGTSVELCGGTHVHATGDIGPFFIIDESGVGSGVRRVEALTGLGAYLHARGRMTVIERAMRALNAGPDEIVEAIDAQVALAAKLKKEVQQLRTRLALGGGPRAPAEDGVIVNGITLVSRQVEEMDKESLRSLADLLKSRLSSGIVLLAGPLPDGKVGIVATVTPDLAGRTPAGRIVRELAPIVGGGGGGRADFAEAGGKDPSKIGEMLAEARKLVERLLAGA